MINNTALKKWERLKQKHLDQQFRNEILTGLSCSPFEADAIVETVHRVYAGYFATSLALKPGQMILEVVAQSEPPQVPLAQCRMVNVRLTLDAGAEDLDLYRREGAVAVRRHRLQRLASEAFVQGGVLTVEDLAYRLLNSSLRTLSRDLAALGKQDISVPLRSRVKDMGRAVTHRALIMRQWLQGKDYSQIARDTHHSIAAVGAYIETFKRIVVLSNDRMKVEEIAFITRTSPALVKEYLRLYELEPIVEARRAELSMVLKKRGTPRRPRPQATRRQS
jgi:hypothetical protein